MPARAYVNGRYQALSDAAIHVEDRGLQFADSIYEVAAVMNGHLFDWQQHLVRLKRGAAALFFAGLPTDAVLNSIARRLLAESRLPHALLYIQVTRGASKRDHPFPKAVRPTVIMTIRPFDFAQRAPQQQAGIAVISLPDQRWGRCDLKTTGLLPAVLAKQEAKAAGAFEAMFVAADGNVTEGGSTNMYMVDAQGVIITHPLSASILPGIARETLLRLARAHQIRVEERPFTLAEARAAPELFVTSTTAPILPIVALDGTPIGTGKPGAVATQLAALTWGEILRQTGWQP